MAWSLLIHSLYHAASKGVLRVYPMGVVRMYCIRVPNLTLSPYVRPLQTEVTAGTEPG